MAAIRDELRTGESTFGKWHSIPGEEQKDRLTEWLDKNPLASTEDRDLANRLISQLHGALKGR